MVPIVMWLSACSKEKPARHPMEQWFSNGAPQDVATYAANIMKVYLKNEKKRVYIEIFIHSLKYINIFLILYKKCARKCLYVLQCATSQNKFENRFYRTWTDGDHCANSYFRVSHVIEQHCILTWFLLFSSPSYICFSFRALRQI
jgi:hypothetical protein